MINKLYGSYITLIETLNMEVLRCIEVSQRFAGIESTTARHFYASVLFTQLCTRGVSLALLAPRSPWSVKKIDHWDYAAIAGITRTLLEIRLTFFYLCVDDCSSDEWECRLNYFNLHDCINRIRLFKIEDTETKDLASFENEAKKLRSFLLSNKYFQNLSEKLKSKFLKCEKPFLLPLKSIAVKAGIDKKEYEYLYIFLSNQIHNHPMSFYRMGKQERGRGLHSEIEEGYTSLCLSFSITLLETAREEITNIFRGLQNV